MKRSFDVLIPHSRSRPNWEMPKAEAMFTGFIENGFNYDSISNNPDLMVYASAELLAVILPQMIEEMFRREDTINYLVYPMIAALDPDDKETSEEYRNRSQKLIALADKSFADAICRLLASLESDPPIPIEDFKRVSDFWKNYLQAF